MRRGLTVLMLAGVTACAPQGGSTTTETVTTPTSPGTSSAAAYTATTVAVNETRGTNTVDVTLPQLAGGAPAVRDRFNSGMHAALEDLLGVDIGPVDAEAGHHLLKGARQRVQRGVARAAIALGEARHDRVDAELRQAAREIAKGGRSFVPPSLLIDLETIRLDVCGAMWTIFAPASWCWPSPAKASERISPCARSPIR